MSSISPKSRAYSAKSVAYRWPGGRRSWLDVLKVSVVSV
jgi:hypothetical protein